MKFIYKHINILQDIFFILILLFISWLFIYTPNEITELPKGIHQWKQSMQFSITKNYALDNDDFMHPSIDGFYNPRKLSGQLVQEFPLLHYIASFFFKKFPYSLKLINILIFIIGIFFTYKLSLKYLNNFFSASIVTINFIFIPIVFYYSFSYITDTSSLFFGIMSMYFYERYLSNNKTINLLISLILFTLCGLLRLPVMAFPAAYFIVQITKKFNLKYIIFFTTSLFIIGLWYIYVMKYNTYYVSTPKELFYFNLDHTQKEKVIFSLKNYMLYQLGYANSNLFYCVFALSVMIAFRHLIDKKLINVFLLGTLFCATYFLLWFGIFDAHDYYLIPITPFFLFLILIFSKILFQISSSLNYIVLGLITIINFSYAWDNIRWRLFQPLPDYSLGLMTKFEEGMHWYIKSEDEKKWKPLRNISPFKHNDILIKNNIHINDTAFCIFDETPTYALSILALKGWTAYSNPFYDNFKLNTNLLNEKINHGLKYLIVYGNGPILQDHLKDSLLKSKLIIQTDSIFIYDVKNKLF